MSSLVPSQAVSSVSTRNQAGELHRQLLWRVEELSAVEHIRPAQQSSREVAGGPAPAQAPQAVPENAPQGPEDSSQALFMHYQVQSLHEYQSGERPTRPSAPPSPVGLRRYRQLQGVSPQPKASAGVAPQPEVTPSLEHQPPAQAEEIIEAELEAPGAPAAQVSKPQPVAQKTTAQARLAAPPRRGRANPLASKPASVRGFNWSRARGR